MHILNILAQRLQSLQRESQIEDAERLNSDAIPAQVQTTNVLPAQVQTTNVRIDPDALKIFLNQYNQIKTPNSSTTLMIADQEESSSTRAQTSQAPDSSFLRKLCCCCRRTDSSQDDGNTYQTESPLQQAAP